MIALGRLVTWNDLAVDLVEGERDRSHRAPASARALAGPQALALDEKPLTALRCLAHAPISGGATRVRLALVYHDKVAEFRLRLDLVDCRH